MPYIYGRNPVWEALQHQQEIQKIYLQHGIRSEKVNQIYKQAKDHKIAITNADRRKLKQLVGEVNHQGIVALISPVSIASLDDYLKQGKIGENLQTLIMLDRIQDPHNMGAIIRSAEIFGVNGVLFPDRGNVAVTDSVVKASAGAALHCPLYKTHNLSQTIDRLQEAELWIYGSAVTAKKTLWEVDFNRHCAIIIGGEEKGIRPSLEKKCDELFHIPQVGKTQSLNASVAAGIILAEISRQRLDRS